MDSIIVKPLDGGQVKVRPETIAAVRPGDGDDDTVVVTLTDGRRIVGRNERLRSPDGLQWETTLERLTAALGQP